MLMAALALSPALLPDAVVHTAAGRPLRPASRQSRADQIAAIFSRSLYDGVKVEECLMEAEVSDETLDCLLPPAKLPAADRSGRLNPPLSVEQKRLHLVRAGNDLDECIVSAESAAELSECEADAALLASGAGAAATEDLAKAVSFATWLYEVPSLIEEIPIRLAATTASQSLSCVSWQLQVPSLIEDIPIALAEDASPKGQVEPSHVVLSTAAEEEAKRAWLARLDQEPSWRKPRTVKTERILVDLADIAPPKDEAEPSPVGLSTAAEKAAEEEAKRAWFARLDQEPSWRKSRAAKTEQMPVDLSDIAPPKDEAEPSPVGLSTAAKKAAEEEAKRAWLARLDQEPSWRKSRPAKTEQMPVDLSDITSPKDAAKPSPVVLSAAAEEPPSFIFTPEFPDIEGPILITKDSKPAQDFVTPAAATPSLIFSLKPVSRRSAAPVTAKVQGPATDSGFWSPDLTIAVALTVAKARLGAARGAGGLGSVRARTGLVGRA